MKLDVLESTALVAQGAAEYIADQARRAVRERGRFLLALSGGGTPHAMRRVLAGLDVPWAAVELFQVDERIVGASSPERTLTQLRDDLVARVPIPAERVHAMPVDVLLAAGVDAPHDRAAAAAAAYAAELQQVGGRPPVLDLVHLGLGEDGHTASLVPDDAVLGVTDRDVAVTGPYHGARRMTLTFPALARARRILWLVTGTAKREALARLLANDVSIPAARVPRANAVIIADRAAAGA